MASYDLNLYKNTIDTLLAVIKMNMMNAVLSNNKYFILDCAIKDIKQEMKRNPLLKEVDFFNEGYINNLINTAIQNDMDKSFMILCNLHDYDYHKLFMIFDMTLEHKKFKLLNQLLDTYDIGHGIDNTTMNKLYNIDDLKVIPILDKIFSQETSSNPTKYVNDNTSETVKQWVNKY